MVSTRKSDIKNHLSAKRPTWSHKIIAPPTHNLTPPINPEREAASAFKNEELLVVETQY
jgi:hypothetical protein